MRTLNFLTFYLLILFLIFLLLRRVVKLAELNRLQGARCILLSKWPLMHVRCVPRPVSLCIDVCFLTVDRTWLIYVLLLWRQRCLLFKNSLHFITGYKVTTSPSKFSLRLNMIVNLASHAIPASVVAPDLILQINFNHETFNFWPLN